MWAWYCRSSEQCARVLHGNKRGERRSSSFGTSLCADSPLYQLNRMNNSLNLLTHIKTKTYFSQIAIICFYRVGSCGRLASLITSHGGAKWPAEPRWRGTQQTRAYEPVRHMGNRWIFPELHPEVSPSSLSPTASRLCQTC